MIQAIKDIFGKTTVNVLTNVLTAGLLGLLGYLSILTYDTYKETPNLPEKIEKINKAISKIDYIELLVNRVNTQEQKLKAVTQELGSVDIWCKLWYRVIKREVL